MDPSAALPVIVNAGGGTAKSEGDSLAEKLREAFGKAGAPIDLHLVEGGDLVATVERFAARPRVAVGGGDGTLGSAARILAASGAELAVLPLGTRNHFARQLDIPLELDEAAALAASGSAIAIDIGETGERTFLNNASLGAYVELVRKRDASGLPKLLGSVVAGADTLRRLRPRRYRLALDGDPQQVDTVQLFIGNNRYEIAEGRAGERERLQDGVLSVFATAPLSRLGLLRTAFRLAIGKPDMKQDFALDRDAVEIHIEGQGMIGIAVDGEECSLPLPLTLRSRARALQVVAPG